MIYIELKVFLNNTFFKYSSLSQNNNLLESSPKIFNLPNIKFQLKIRINTPDTKHIKKILVILSRSH